MDRIKNPIKLLLYIILYLYYAIGMSIHFLYIDSLEPDQNGICVLWGAMFLQAFIRPIIGQIIALLLLLLPPDSFYKKNILSNSNKILLGSFIVDCLIMLIPSQDGVETFFSRGHLIDVTTLMLLFTGGYLPFYITYLLWKLNKIIFGNDTINSTISNNKNNNNIIKYFRYIVLFIIYNIMLFFCYVILPKGTPTIFMLLYHLALGLIFAILLTNNKLDTFYKRAIYPKSNYIMIGLIIFDCVVCLAVGITAIQDVVETSILFLFTGAYLPFYLVYLGHHFLQYLRERKN